MQAVALRRERWFRRHPRLTLSLFFLVVVLVLDVALGTTLHAFGISPVAGKSEAAFRTRHEVYHHGLRPGVAFDHARWGHITYKIRTDSLGFKNAEVRDVPLESPGERLLLIGDSFTEGIGMAYEDTFAGMLAKRLAPLGIEVLNAGVIHYSPTIYLRKLEYLIGEVGLRVDRVFVFLDMSDIQDEAEYFWLDERRNVVRETDNVVEEGVKDFIQDNTVLMSAIRSFVRQLRRGVGDLTEAGALQRWRCFWASDEAAWQAYGEKGLALATGHMDSLQRFLEARGIGLTVCVYPWPDQILRQDLESRQVTHWRQWAARRRVGFIDCFPSFIDGGPAEEVLERCFIPGDVHWNRAGHALIAQRVYEHLWR